MTDRARIVSNMLGVVGAAVGGYVGYWLFFWIRRQDFYAMAVPGALLGLGCGLLARHSSKARGMVCGAAGVALGLYTEWKHAPFQADDSFLYLLSHPQLLRPLTIAMIGLGAFLAYWLGKDGGYGDPARSLKPPPFRQ